MNRLLLLLKTKSTRFKRYKSFFQELQGRYGYLFAHLRARFMPRKSIDKLADDLHNVMVESLSSMVENHVKEQVKQQVPEQVHDQVLVYVAEGFILERKKTKDEMEWLIAKAILQEHGNTQTQISSQLQKGINESILSQVDASVRSYMYGHILHVHPVQSQTTSVPDQQYQLVTVPQTACKTSVVRPRDQDDPHDDAHPEGENSAKRRKTSEYEAYVSGESSSGQVFQEEQAPSTSGNQEQDDDFDFWTDSYAYDDDEILTKQITPLVQSCQRDPEAPALSLINQDLLYLKKGNSGPEKIVLSLYKFHAVIFGDNDIYERTSRWVNKCVRKFNPYARYGVEHWKNP
ncbi:hypothetical protein Tco_1039125, partial [Tanacetum coccineum]